MLETAIALVLGHMVGDFLLQTGTMVTHKRQFRTLAAHVGVVTAASWIALGFPLQFQPFLALFLTHALIDWVKTRSGSGFGPFILDQAAHFATIHLIAHLAPGLWAAGLWSHPALSALLPDLPEAMILGSGLIGSVFAGGYAVQALLSHLLSPGQEASLPGGGKLIGRLERLMILVLILIDEPDGIGFLIAAKSILRFGEVNREGAKDDGRMVSEYVIIGTLASFGWALSVAWCARTALALLGP